MTRPYLAAILAAAALAACSGEPAPASSPTPQATASAEPQETADPLRQVLGQWEVERIAGDAPQYARMLLVFGEDWWHMQSQCVWANGDFRIDGAVLDFVPVERDFPGIEQREGPMRAMCARGLSPAEEALPQVLAGSREFLIREDGRLVIPTPSGPLVARRLSEPVANPMEFTDWDPATTFGEWRVASLDGEPVEDAALIVAGPYSSLRVGCRYYQWLNWDDMMGKFERLRREPFRTGCDRPETEQEDALARAYQTTETFSADGPDRRILSGPEGRIVLARPD